MSPEENIRFLSKKLEEETQKRIELEKALQEAEQKVRNLEADRLISDNSSFAEPKSGLIWLIRHPRIYPLATVILENLMYALLIYDAESKIVLMNRQFSELVKQTHSSPPIGQPLELIQDRLVQKLANPALLEDLFSNTDRVNVVNKSIDLELLDGSAISFQEIPLWQDGIYQGGMWIAYNITQNLRTSKR
jgi:PAS domain-containing protein